MFGDGGKHEAALSLVFVLISKRSLIIPTLTVKKREESRLGRWRTRLQRARNVKL